MRTLTYVVAVSLDGFVCAPDGSFDFFPDGVGDTGEFTFRELPELIPTHLREHFGIDALNKRFDTMLQGRGSYQVALDVGITRPYAHMREYVFSHTLPQDVDPHVTVVSTDPVATVRELKREENGLDVCLVGGPTIAGALLPEIDEILLKRYPVVAGAGKPVFHGAFTPTAFERARSIVFDSGADYTFFTRPGHPSQRMHPVGRS